MAADGAADATDAVATPAPVADPRLPGPYATSSLDATHIHPATGDKLAIHCVYPTSGKGPFPVVVIAHGFQLSPAQYFSYADRLASFGYIALTVDFPTSLLGNDNPKQAADLSAGLDWAAVQPQWAGQADTDRAGVVGHSLGGKLAVLAAALDPRFRAAFGIDPVDSGGSSGCEPPACVDATEAAAKLAIATGFVGETIDGEGSFQACAPAADNYQAFFAAAPSPSFSLTAIGANHMSFLDDLEQCGVICGFCNKALAAPEVVGDMTRAVMTAFFERRLRGIVGYDTWLTGALAEQHFVAPGLASVQVK